MNENYNDNSRPQMKAIHSTISYVHEAISMLDTEQSSSPMIIADFGCAQGSNSIHVMKVIIQYLKESHKIEDETQVLVVHNDVPSNGWTILFECLNNENSYHGVANGRSFYELCLPPNSLSIGYSSTAIHLLSRKPCNISNHCVDVFARGDELKAFEEQARLDWDQFLKHRSEELIDGGVLIVVTLSVDDRRSIGCDILLELLYRCAQSCLTRQESLDYTIPMYSRSYREVVDEQLFARYSLELIKADFSPIRSPFIEQWKNGQLTKDECIRSIRLYVQNWAELSLKEALQMNKRSKSDIESILGQFWSLSDDEARKEFDQLLDTCVNYTYVVLKKKKTVVE